MPGSGKSTVGVLLAKATATAFIDTDLIIQLQTGKTLQTLVDECGVSGFSLHEDKALLSVNADCDTVIATGGSAVFCSAGMDFLRRNGVTVYLDVPLEEVKRRLSNITTRGIACRKGESVDEIFAQRASLYEQYADIKVECAGFTAEQLVGKIIDGLGVEFKRT